MNWFMRGFGVIFGSIMIFGTSFEIIFGTPILGAAVGLFFGAWFISYVYIKETSQGYDLGIKQSKAN